MMMMRRLYILILSFLAACSGIEMKRPTNNVQNNSTNNTNNTAKILKLRFLSPANGELSMNSQSRAQVEVALETLEGLPAPEERVDVHIDGVASGSTLSSSFVVSDETGKLVFQILSGANSAHFRVILQHPQAVPLSLDVTVSSSGMVRLRVAFSYEGTITPEDLGMLELGIAFDASCESIEPYVVDLDRIRRISSWDVTEELTELPVDISFSIVTRGFSHNGEPLLHGCLTPDASMRIPNASIDVTILLADYSKSLLEPVIEEISTVATPVAAAAAEGFSGWSETGRCPLGLSQLFVDCLLAVMEDGDRITCTPGNPTPETVSLHSRRGVLDTAGCRQVNNPESGASLESRIHDVLNWQSYQSTLMDLYTYLATGYPESVTFTVQLAPEAFSFILEVTQIRFDDGAFQPILTSARRRLQCPMHPDTCIVEPFLLTLFWYDALVQDISNTFFKVPGMTVNGADFSLHLQDDATQIAFPETLSIFFARELGVQIPDAVWEQAFIAMGTALDNPMAVANRDRTAPDCQISGNLYLTDDDFDQYLDEVGISLAFDLCFANCSWVLP